MEDLRFCREFKHKQQRQTSTKFEDSATEEEFNPKYSGDEGKIILLFFIVYSIFFPTFFSFVYFFGFSSL